VQNQQCVAQATKSVLMGLKKANKPTRALFVWLINHQPAVLFSQNKSAISNQTTVLFSQNKATPTISHQSTEQVVGFAQLQNCICNDPSGEKIRKRTKPHLQRHEVI
jgi:hypothetical protein